MHNITATEPTIEPQIDDRPKVVDLTLDQWQQFAQAHPAGTVFHHRNWIELLIAQYGGSLTIPGILRGGRVVAALPLIETRNLRGTRRLVGLPYTDCLPVLSESDDDTAMLCEAASALSGKAYESITVRTEQKLDGFTATSDSVRHLLDLSRPVPEIEKSFDKGLRRNLRKAEKRGLRFQRRTDLDAVHEFYRLQVATRVKHGVPVQPRRFFSRLHDMLIARDLGYVGLVKQDGRCIAAGVFLQFNNHTIYKYGASDPRALEHRPNELLMRNAIHAAHEERSVCFDFGISARSNEGLRRFKRKWRAVETDAYHVYLAGEPRNNCDESAAFRLASHVIRRSPAIVCRTLGELFYRYSQ